MNLVYFEIGDDRTKALNRINQADKLIKGTKKIMYLGLTKCLSHDDIDWILSKTAVNQIKVVNIGEIEIPSLKVRIIELVHSYGCNTIMNFNHDAISTIQNTDYIKEIAVKYEIPEELVIMKGLLQLGTLICIPYDIGVEKLEVYSRLVHPFVHRRQFVSSFKIISLEISADDFNNIINKSEEVEAKEDENWKKHVKSLPQQRNLSY